MFEIIKNRNLDVTFLENLKIIRVTNTAEQIKSLEKINDFEKLSLLIIDNVADLFSFEYSKKEQFMLKYSSFMKYMHHLSTIALKKKIPVIVTNQLLQKQDTEYEKLDFVMNHFIHQRIKLRKIKNYYQGEVYHPFTNNQQFCYNFGPSGIVEQSESI